MFNWLKEILGDAYTEEIDTAVSKKVGELFVSKEDFNKKNEDLKGKDNQIKELHGQIKDRDKQLNDLKKVDAEDLQKQIETLQAENKSTAKAYEAKIAAMRLDSAVESALRASGARDAISVKAHLADFLKDAKVADDGTVAGLSEKIAGLKGSEATSFLFAEETGSKPAGAKAADLGTGSDQPATKKPEEMTYEDFVKAEEAAGQR